MQIKSMLRTMGQRPYGNALKVVAVATFLWIVSLVLSLFAPALNAVVSSIGIALVVIFLCFLIFCESRMRGQLNDIRSLISLELGLRRWNVELENFFTDGAAANPSLQLLNLKVLTLCQPRSVLELGSGQTTKIMSHYSRLNPQADVVTLEQNGQWWEMLRSEITHDYRYAELESCKIVVPGRSKKVSCEWYGRQPEFAHKKFAYVLVDGPDSGQAGTVHVPFARAGVLQILPEALDDDFVVVFDDAERSGELMTIEAFAKKLVASRKSFVRFSVCGSKTQEVFCSPAYAFLRSV